MKRVMSELERNIEAQRLENERAKEAEERRKQDERERKEEEYRKREERRRNIEIVFGILTFLLALFSTIWQIPLHLA